MPWKPDSEEKKYLELIASMSLDCLRGQGTVNVDTYISNLKAVVNILEKIHKVDQKKEE